MRRSGSAELWEPVELPLPTKLQSRRAFMPMIRSSRTHEPQRIFSKRISLMLTR